jgi:hypothetical protein
LRDEAKKNKYLKKIKLISSNREIGSHPSAGLKILSKSPISEYQAPPVAPEMPVYSSTPQLEKPRVLKIKSHSVVSLKGFQTNHGGVLPANMFHPKKEEVKEIKEPEKDE